MNTDTIVRTLLSRLRALEYLATVETSRGVEVVAVRHPQTRAHGEPWLVALVSTADWSVSYAVPAYRGTVESTLAAVLRMHARGGGR